MAMTMTETMMTAAILGVLRSWTDAESSDETSDDEREWTDGVDSLTDRRSFWLIFRFCFNFFEKVIEVFLLNAAKSWNIIASGDRLIVRAP